MTIPIRIALTESLDFEELSIRGQRRALKASYEAMGQRWLDKHLPRHFIRGAGTRYGYKQRSAKYLKRKERLAKQGVAVQDGGRTLLVFTGELRDHLTSGAGVSLRAFPTRASVRLTAPHGLPLRPRRANQPNIGQELTAITPDEEADLAKVAERTLAKEMRAAGKKTKRTTIGG